jgi:hypothetical protein
MKYFKWNRLVDSYLIMQKNKFKENYKLLVTIRNEIGNVFRKVLKNIKRTFECKICKAAKEMIDKEVKEKRKKLRRKWKMFMEKYERVRCSEIVDKFNRKVIWKKFREKKDSFGMILKNKIIKYTENASQRNRMLMSLLRTTVINIHNEVLKRTNELKRKRIIFEDMSFMTSFNL